MANFQEAYKIVRANEGGYVNHKNDTGGETYKGIARNYHPTWPGWVLVDRWKGVPNFPKNLDYDVVLQSQVRAFFKAKFWDVMKLDDVVNEELAVELFDTGVNMNTTVAVNFLQRALNVLNKQGLLYPDVPKDGIMGPKTLQVLNSHPDPKAVLKILNCLQGARYVSIAEGNPSQEVFMYGWLTRVHL